MARNEEKQLARLNRLLLKNQHEEELKKNPRRPHLSTLTTETDIKKWLPSIKRELDFCLKQMQVPCYPERKVEEFKVQISHLQRQHKAFVQKLKNFGQSGAAFQEPWVDRPYDVSHKRPITDTDVDNDEKLSGEDQPAEKKRLMCLKERISLPLLDGEDEQVPCQGTTQPTIVSYTEGPTQPTIVSYTEVTTQPATVSYTEGPTQPAIVSNTEVTTQPATVSYTEGTIPPTTVWDTVPSGQDRQLDFMGKEFNDPKKPCSKQSRDNETHFTKILKTDSFSVCSGSSLSEAASGGSEHHGNLIQIIKPKTSLVGYSSSDSEED